jgi:acyl-CoA synthetase (AMP-forming)/AMP-acid ligase II
MRRHVLDFETFADLPRFHGKHRPNHPALVFRDRRTTYRELNQFSSRVANGLIAFDPSPFARFAHLGKNSDRFFEIYFGGAKARQIMVPINWRLTASEVAYILSDVQPAVLFIEKEFCSMLSEIESLGGQYGRVIILDDDGDPNGYLRWRDSQSETDPQLTARPDDVHIILYTSGTTGQPKGVMLTNSSEFALRRMELHLDPSCWHPNPSDVVLCQLPCFHLSGSSWTFLWMYYGSTIVIQPQARVDDMLDALERERINHIQVVPALLQTILDHPRCARLDLSSLKTIFYGGAPFPLPLLQRVLTTLRVDLFQLYGMTECSGFIAMLLPEDVRTQDETILKSCGRPYPLVELGIMDAEGHRVPDLERGEICVLTPGLMAGYWQRPEETAGAMHGNYYRTGDVGYRDPKGYYFLVDRVKDMIVSGGENIYPAEIERVLAQHPGIREVAVIGVADPTWGESVKAVVVRADPQLTDASLRDYARRFLAGYKVPKTVDFVADLPRNPSGKVLKRVLREQYRTRALE